MQELCLLRVAALNLRDGGLANLPGIAPPSRGFLAWVPLKAPTRVAIRVLFGLRVKGFIRFLHMVQGLGASGFRVSYGLMHGFDVASERGYKGSCGFIRQGVMRVHKGFAKVLYGCTGVLQGLF